MQSGDSSVQFNLGSGTIKVDAGLVEKLRLAMISYVDGPDFPARFQEVRGSMRAELQNSAVWIHDDGVEMGAWNVTVDNDRLVLVRYPPPVVGTMYIYRATMEPDGSTWRVVSLDVERENGPD